MWQDFWDAFIYFPDDPFKYTAVWSSSVIWSVQCFDALALSLSLHLLLARNQTWHDVSVKDNLVYKQQDKFDFYFHSIYSITIWTPPSSCLFFAHSNANNTDLANSWQLMGRRSMFWKHKCQGWIDKLGSFPIKQVISLWSFGQQHIIIMIVIGKV